MPLTLDQATQAIDALCLPPRLHEPAEILHASIGLAMDETQLEAAEYRADGFIMGLRAASTSGRAEVEHLERLFEGTARRVRDELQEPGIPGTSFAALNAKACAGDL